MEFTDFELAWFRRPIDVPPAPATSGASGSPPRLARGSLPPGRLGLVWTGWALCPWADTGGDEDLVHPDDVDRLRALSPYGKVFEVGLTIDDYTELHHDGALFRVRPTLLRQVPGPRFAVGERVRIRQTAAAARVCAVGWHHREHRLFYVLRGDAAPDARRYWEDELDAHAAPP